MLKLFRLSVVLLCAILFSDFSYSQTVDNASFESAEARVKYNKQNGLPRYSGVSITYKIQLLENIDQNRLENLLSTEVVDMVGYEIRQEGDFHFLYVSTKGHLENHRALRTLSANEMTLKFIKAIYFLD